MDREEIIKLAREVGYPLVEYEGTPYIPPLLAVLLKAVAAEQRTWVGLTDKEIDQGLCRTNYAMQTADAWRDGVEWAIKQLQERNT